MTGRAIVCGAGVAGLTSALALREAGWSVEVIAPDTSAPSASLVAAGMLAPAAEALTDSVAPPYPLAARALALWPAFAELTGSAALIVRCGTLWPAAQEGHALALRAAELGVRLERTAAGLFAPDDARVEVAQTLERLRSGLRLRGVGFRDGAAARLRSDGVTLGDGETLRADVVVAAAGWSSHRWAADLPALYRLSPVGGQLVRFAPAPGGGVGPMIRVADGYLCPSSEGVAAGGSMEVGVARTEPDGYAAVRQADLARRLKPELSETPYRALAGARAATPDGQPLVGRTPEGVILATGLRRNGWLLAPLVAQVVARAAAGEAPEPWAEAWAPTRAFSPPAGS